MPSDKRADPEFRPVLLRGNSLGLALMRGADVPAIARWNQDLEFTARLGTPGDAHTVEMRQEAYNENSRCKPNSVEFAIVKLDSERLIGFGGLFDMTRANAGTLFIGIGEAEERGKGYGIEASRLICEYAFYFRNLYNIKVEVHAYNQPALRTYERLGFKLAGRLRGVNMLNGKRYDEIVMDLVRDEFELRYVSAFKSLEVAAG